MNLTTRIGLILGALAVAITGLIATPSTAQADGGGCTSASGPGYLCIQLYGDGTYVNNLQGARSKPGQWLCNYEIKAWGTLANGSTWSQTKLTGCGWSRVWADFYPRTRFKDNTRFCVASREQGSSWEPYYACVWIEA